MEAVLAIVCLAIAVASLLEIRKNPRITRRFFGHTATVIFAYAVFCVCGVGIIVLLPAERGETASAMVALFFLAWVMFGGLWLARVAPGLRELPAWIRREWSLLDLSLLAVIAVAAIGASIL